MTLRTTDGKVLKLGFDDWDDQVLHALGRLKNYATTAAYLARRNPKRKVTSQTLRNQTYALRMVRLIVAEYLREYEARRRALGPTVTYLNAGVGASRRRRDK